MMKIVIGKLDNQSKRYQTYKTIQGRTKYASVLIYPVHTIHTPQGHTVCTVKTPFKEFSLKTKFPLKAIKSSMKKSSIPQDNEEELTDTYLRKSFFIISKPNL